MGRVGGESERMRRNAHKAGFSLLADTLGCDIDRQFFERTR